MELRYPEGATPLDPDARAGLIPDLATQAELNEFEALNIAAALRWALPSRSLRRDLLTESGLRLLHRRMLGRTWRWAGTLRTVDTNLGVPSWKVPTELRQVCDDVRYWQENATFPPAEIAVRFHHRLVSVHPFPNGNGRHSRLAADLLLHYGGLPMLAWGDHGGTGDLVTEGTLRREYLSALRAADAHDYAPLLRFAALPIDEEPGRG